MDEATAAIDYKTDSKIQETISHLQSTTITIAHRLGTVVENDRIVVLDQGQVKEFGRPYELLQKEGGLFYDMCLSSGEMEVLQEKSKKSYDKKMRRGSM